MLDETTPEVSAVVRIVNGVFPSNTYLCRLSEPGACAIIDPGLDPTKISGVLDQEGLIPAAIICTHGHFDHIGSAHFFQQKYKAPLYFPAADVAISRRANFLLMAYKISVRIALPTADVLLNGATSIEVAGDRFDIYPTPGHTPGSCAIGFGRYLFVGDTFYRRGVEELMLPGENKELLRQSIQYLWTAVQDDVFICPGHGGSATLQEIRESNTALREFLATGKYRS